MRCLIPYVYLSSLPYSSRLSGSIKCTLNGLRNLIPLFSNRLPCPISRALISFDSYSSLLLACATSSHASLVTITSSLCFAGKVYNMSKAPKKELTNIHFVAKTLLTKTLQKTWSWDNWLLSNLLANNMVELLDALSVVTQSICEIKTLAKLLR